MGGVLGSWKVRNAREEGRDEGTGCRKCHPKVRSVHKTLSRRARRGRFLSAEH